MILVRGDTFPFRKALKGMGGVWDAQHQAWVFPDEKEGVLTAVVGNVGGIDVRFVPNPKPKEEAANG